MGSFGNNFDSRCLKVHLLSPRHVIRRIGSTYYFIVKRREIVTKFLNFQTQHKANTANTSKLIQKLND
jgi:hypothetical protein